MSDSGYILRTFVGEKKNEEMPIVFDTVEEAIEGINKSLERIQKDAIKDAVNCKRFQKTISLKKETEKNWIYEYVIEDKRYTFRWVIEKFNPSYFFYGYFSWDDYKKKYIKNALEL